MTKRTNDQVEIAKICRAFLVELVDAGYATHPDLFPILDDEARENNLSLRADQRGIAGTYISLVPNT